MKIANSNLKKYFAELVAEVNNGISLSDPSIDTEMGTKDDGNNGDSTGGQDKDEDETSNEETRRNTSDASERQLADRILAPTILRWCFPNISRCPKRGRHFT